MCKQSMVKERPLLKVSLKVMNLDYLNRIISIIREEKNFESVREICELN